ncbi:MAG: NusG domain II-containing protein [Spirochaetia bacterium]|nr:NusG domain II-containing protein [Spirochaetia bacterium]
MKNSFPTLLVDTLILLLSIAILLAIASASFGGSGGYVNVESPEGSYRYSLATDREVVVHGPLGETHIIIENGSAKIIDSPCPTKTCVQQGAIANSSGWIACLPNQILLTIVSSGDGEMEVDDVAN